MNEEKDAPIREMDSLESEDCKELAPFVFDFDLESLHSQTDETRLEPSSPGANMLKSPDRRSPSCSRGKTMKDFEEELNTLRRENFDLKMRIYVLNEHLDLIQSVDNVEEIYETHTKLKKEIQSLKVELSDKEDLILKTGEAMNLLSNKHREEIALLKAKAQEEAEQYQDIISRLKQEYTPRSKLVLPSHRPEFDDSSAMYAMAFALNENFNGNAPQDRILEEQVLKLEAELALKSKQIEEADEKIKTLQEQISALQVNNKTTEKELKSKADKLEDVFNELRQREIQADDLHKRIFSLESSVKDKEAELEVMSLKLESLKSVEDTINTCKKQLDHSRNENESLQHRVKPSCKTCVDKAKLEEKVSTLKACIAEKENALEEARVEQHKTIKALQGFMKANKALRRDLDNLQEQMKKMDEKEGNRSRTEGMTGSKCDEEYIRDLESKIKTLTENLKESELKLKELSEKDPDVEKEERVEELEHLVSTLKGQLDTILTKKSKENEELSSLRAEIELKNKSIEQLNEELRKRTFNLQELVNKELWDKNREIEKLNTLCEKKQNESMELRTKMESQQEELIALNDKIQELSDNISCKLTKKDVEKLREDYEKEKDNNKALSEKCNNLEKEVTKSEKARKELVNACVLLQTRLEELVFFMDSLIPSLAGKNRRILQEAVERSREASRTLTLSVLEDTVVHTPTPILPDFSQVDFCCDSFNLSAKILSKSNLANQTQESVVDKPSEDNKLNGEVKESKASILSSLKEKDRIALKELNDMAQSFVLDEMTEGSIPDFLTDDTEPQIVDDNGKKSPPKEIINISESEEWSEPDRNVSKARIGIPKESISKTSNPADSSDQSENSDKQNPSKRRHKSNDVRRLNLKLKQLGNVIETLRLSPSKTQPDSSFTIQINDQVSTASIIDKISEGRNHIDSSLKQSEYVLNQIKSLSLEEAGRSALEEQLSLITDSLTNLTMLCQEMESFLIQAESDKKDLCLKMFDNDRKIDGMNTSILRLQSELKEKENEVLEKQCALLELKNEYLITETKGKNIESRLAEANVKLQEYLKNADKEKQISKERHAQEISSLQQKFKQKQDEHNKEINQLKILLDRANESIQELNLARLRSEEEHKQQLDLIMKESKATLDDEINKRMDAERKLVKSYEMQADLRNQLENEITNTRTIGSAQRKMESWWRKKLHELEAACLERESDLRRRLDAATLSTSQAVLERTRLANDKIRLQCELRRRDDNAHDVKAALEQRVTELEEANNELEKKLACIRMPRSEPGSPTHNFNRQRSNPTSDYTSDPDHHGSSNNIWFPVCGRNNNNCSPDLGIESDQGRLSSLDAISSPKSHGNLEQLISENRDLREQLDKTKHALSKALNLLDDSKKVKKLVEKAICHQIVETKHILTKARLNLQAPEPNQVS
ncbi:centrosomin isoform X3 [Cimex lectularius]|uniref:Centrosomin N-terminal motif 1 domain-containing protein n=1 Tax=Cimex lectularius TaxID=79782 RepID=A0A8I6RYM0_CIMLE|nr:centrosomin isoform X3 [Cimex lectularius]